MPIQHIITDIEGTTTDIAFVHKVLFPYATQHLPNFIAAHANSPEVRAQLEAVSKETGRPLSDSEAVSQLLRWIEEDKKIGPLKALQGMIWAQGYRQGELEGHVYDDAAKLLQQWHSQGVKLYVYSSGSVKAQQLIYGHSNHGDLTPLFSGYFDTRIGHKRETSSYEIIRDALGGDASTQLFLSDITEELDAAAAAGMHTALLVRGDSEVSNSQHSPHADFSSVDTMLNQLT
ncbi:MAG: acireductone synthase [Gammaproteobacteria bacterium]|nr:acireductone synthase [Gammaproteobacteria bacterium]